MPPEVQNRSIWLSAFRWALVCWVIVFWRLDYPSLIDDEAHYAQLTHEMMRAGSWLVPTLDGVPFIDKPILFHWVQGLAFALFGEGEFSASLPSAMAAIALLVITAMMGRRLVNGRGAEHAWMMLATIPATFALSRVGYLDMLFTACLFGAVSCLVLSALQGRPRLQYIGHALLVLAIMTKGPVALALVGVFLMLSWFAGGDCRAFVRALHWRRGLAVAVFGAAPWFLWMFRRFGATFVNDYLLIGHLGYLSPRGSGSSSATSFYLQMFVTVCFPWSIVALGSLVDHVRGWRRGERPDVIDRLLWIWIVAVVLLFTLARFRVDRYIFPVAPACCLLAARAWLLASEVRDGRRFMATRLSIFSVAILLVVLGATLAIRLPALALDLPITAFLLPLELTAGGALFAFNILRNHFRPPASSALPVAVLVSAYAVVVAVGFPLLEHARPTKQVGTWIQSQSSDADQVGLYHLDRWQTTLRYYGTRPVQRLDDEDAVRRFLAGPGRRWLVTQRGSLSSITQGHPGADVSLTVPAVVGSSGRGLRRQVWSDVVVVRHVSTSETQPGTADPSGIPARAHRQPDDTEAATPLVPPAAPAANQTPEFVERRALLPDLSGSGGALDSGQPTSEAPPPGRERSDAVVALLAAPVFESGRSTGPTSGARRRGGPLEAQRLPATNRASRRPGDVPRPSPVIPSPSGTSISASPR